MSTSIIAGPGAASARSSAAARLDGALGLQGVQQAQQGGAVDVQRAGGLGHVGHGVAGRDVAQQPRRALHRGER